MHLNRRTKRNEICDLSSRLSQRRVCETTAETRKSDVERSVSNSCDASPRSSAPVLAGSLCSVCIFNNNIFFLYFSIFLNISFLSLSFNIFSLSAWELINIILFNSSPSTGFREEIVAVFRSEASSPLLLLLFFFVFFFYIFFFCSSLVFVEALIKGSFNWLYDTLKVDFT